MGGANIDDDGLQLDHPGQHGRGQAASLDGGMARRNLAPGGAGV